MPDSGTDFRPKRRVRQSQNNSHPSPFVHLSDIITPKESRIFVLVSHMMLRYLSCRRPKRGGMLVRIAEFAKALGVSRDTIRRLERRGVISAKRDWAGHRRFTEADLDRIRAILFRSDHRPQTN